MRKFLAALTLTALVSVTALGQDQGAPTLRVVTETPGLPSDLFYGNTKVKPLRLRPGTNQPITIDDSDFFVQQQYIDFLRRFPEQGGFDYWMNRLNTCASTPGCDMVRERIAVSAGFYFSPEFHRKGYFAYRFYKASLGRKPGYSEFVPDMSALQGLSEAEEEPSRVAFTEGWVRRAEFRQRYDALTDEQFVNLLVDTAGVSLDRGALLDRLRAGGTRAGAVRSVVESPEVSAKEFQEAVVAMMYFGYLRRDYDEGGFQYWLERLRANPGDLHAIAGGFIYSREYREQRF